MCSRHQVYSHNTVVLVFPCGDVDVDGLNETWDDKLLHHLSALRLTAIPIYTKWYLNKNNNSGIYAVSEKGFPLDTQ